VDQRRGTGEDRTARALERCRERLASDAELRRSASSPQARERIAAEGLSSLQRVALTCEIYADRPCFGERAFVVQGGRIRFLPSLRHLTYDGLWTRVRSFASGLLRMGVGLPGDFIGIYGFASIDWVVADLACLYLSAVSVPLQTIATAEELRPIFAETRPTCIVSSLELIDVIAAALPAAPGVRAVVLVDGHEGDVDELDRLAAAREQIQEERPALAIATASEIERIGQDAGIVSPVEPTGPEALRTLVYTSGSTGSPKGAMFSEGTWTRYWQSPWMPEVPEVPLVSVDYMPLNHMAGRGSIVRSMVQGGVTSFVHASDMSTLFEDIRIARPTMLLFVPRVSSMIHKHFQSEVARRGTPNAEREVMDEMRSSFLGDRLVYLATGAAPTAPEVTEFLGRCFDVPVLDGYGSTEAGAIALDGRIAHENVEAYTLVDVPELGYTTRDLPHPRGELHVKVRAPVTGYYQNAAATSDLFTESGFIRTGDVVEELARDVIQWIDRKKNVLKLAQGEFVSISRLEELYAAGSSFIRQIYLYGTSLWSYLLAVIVPAGEADRALLRREIDRIAAREGLRGYEVPRDFLVETVPFTRENGLLTESNKPARPKLRARYGSQLEARHDAIERRQLEELHALELDRDRPIDHKIARAFALTLGIAEPEALDKTRGFVNLGGDSLGAVELVAHIAALTGVDLSVGLVLDPTSSVASIVDAIRQRLSGAAERRVTFADVHGAGASAVRAEDLRIERFLSSAELAAASGAPPSGPPTVVLTGANGFLGRFLVLDLLERLAPRHGKLVAIVRARSDESARQRLAASYEGVDPALPSRFAELSSTEGSLEVIAGDLIEPRLGLSPARWDHLASQVSAIVHNGALVNHAFSYAQLFEPNVLGTVEMIRLALRRRAPLSLLSTVGVAGGVDRVEPVREDEDALALWKSRPVDSGYAVGYSTSKWADELLARDFESRTGVPVSVFRCSMIMPPCAYVGPVNTTDFLTRLLESVIVTGIAPRSFYAEGAARHFDGLPVDVIARAIGAISVNTGAGFATYQAVNGHNYDGVSLDTMVSWIQRAGYPLARIDDYEDWVKQLRARLVALSPVQQHRSMLPILHHWDRPSASEVLFDNGRLRARLEALGEPAWLPDIDEHTLRRYLENMRHAALIPGPAEAPSPARA